MLTVVAPAHLLIQAERLGVGKETLKYFAAVASGSIDGDGHVSAAMKAMCLASGKRAVAMTGGPPSRHTASRLRWKTLVGGST